MMYTYSLLVSTPGSSNPSGYDPVRPGPDMEIATMAELQAQVQHDLGFVPDWLQGCPPDEYIQVEDEHQVKSVWFCVVAEGSQDHVLPPLAEMIAFVRNHVKEA